MNAASRWLSEYAEAHRDPTNRRLHMVCVPLITWSLLVLLFALHWSLAVALITFALVFYIAWGSLYFFAMLLFALLSVASACLMIRADLHVKSIAFVVFAVAWAGQFYGHSLEGQKPKFLDDLWFLLVGPAWILHEIFRRD